MPSRSDVGPGWGWTTLHSPLLEQGHGPRPTRVVLRRGWCERVRVWVTVAGEQEVIVGSTHFLVVAGPMSAALSRTMQERFDDVCVTVRPTHSVIECSVRDQSALRALVTQLWDAGCELLLVSQILESPRSHHGHTHY